MFHFAYGSNLDATNWTRWCETRGYDPGSMEPVGAAWLPDFEPVFHYRSRLRSGGTLDVRPRRGTATPGALFRVHDWAGLDAKEGVSGGYYERTHVTALTEDGRAHDAITYKVCASRVRGFIAPEDEYLRIVQRGLSRFGHSDGQLLAVARGVDAAPLPNALFAYGTLMRGKRGHELIRPHLRAMVAGAFVERAALVRIDWYPGLVLQDNGSVRGELFQLEESAAALGRLDEYEDFHGYDQPESLFRRSLVRVRTEDREALAWTYTYVGSIDGLSFIESGEWAP